MDGMRASFILGVVLVIGLTTSCQDKAEAPLAACKAAEAKGDLGAAVKACEQAANANPSSQSGLAAGTLLVAINGKIAEKKRAEAEAIAAAEPREEAKCSDWMVTCTPGGASHYKNRAACQKLVTDTAGMGVTCGACVCYSSAP